MPGTQTDWIVAATLATALFTGGYLLIGWLVYQQARQDTARARPLKLSAVQKTRELEAARRAWKPAPYMHELAIRETCFHLYNRSSVPQFVNVAEVAIRWPRETRWKSLDDGLAFRVEPYEGGNIFVRFVHWDWKETLNTDELQRIVEREDKRHRYVIRLKLNTVSGQSYSITRWSTLYRHDAGGVGVTFV